MNTNLSCPVVTSSVSRVYASSDREQRRDHSNRIRQSYQSLESTLSSLQQSIEDLNLDKKRLNGEFEELLSTVYNAFVKVGGDKLLNITTEDTVALVPMSSGDVLGSPAGKGDGLALTGTASAAGAAGRTVSVGLNTGNNKDTPGQPGPGTPAAQELPSMFNDPAVIQSMKAGITVNNLPQVSAVSVFSWHCWCCHVVDHDFHHAHCF